MMPVGANWRKSMVTEEEIKKLARSIWEAERCPDGKNWEYYFRARQMLEEKERVLINMDKMARMMAVPEREV